MKTRIQKETREKIKKEQAAGKIAAKSAKTNGVANGVAKDQNIWSAE